MERFVDDAKHLYPRFIEQETSRASNNATITLKVERDIGAGIAFDIRRT